MNKYCLLLSGLLATQAAPAAVIADSIKWNLDTPGISGDNEAIDRLGQTVARGDFNGDGHDDLAIGIPNHDFFGGVILNTGTVLVIYGAPGGLSSSDEQYLFQTFDNSGSNLETENGIEANEFFGQSMASGDFNCDGFADLAVGTPDEDVTLSGEDLGEVGAINIFYGSANGFPDNGQGSTFLWQGSGQGRFSLTSLRMAIDLATAWRWAILMVTLTMGMPARIWLWAHHLKILAMQIRPQTVVWWIFSLAIPQMASPVKTASA